MSNEQLAQLLSRREDYLPAAVVAAEAALAGRGLTEPERSRLLWEADLAQMQAELRAELPLAWWEKGIFALLPLAGILFWLIWQTQYRDQGLHRKSRESGVYILAGMSLLIFLLSFFLG